MKVLKLVQGTDEWRAARAKHFTASEASVMMGASKQMTRNDLLRLKATGAEKEISDYTRDVIFERGHEVEAAARAIAERIIGEDLYPVTGVEDDGNLLASFDGLAMLADLCWECKQWNKEKAEVVRNSDVPEEDRWQCVQQLVVSRAEKLLYMVTDGTEENTVFTWFRLNPDDEKKLRAGWKQFAEDLANYEPAAPVAEVVGRAPESLPSLRIEVTGAVTASNLPEFKETALAVFKGINRDLQTDEDFADAEKAVKWCKEVEDRLEGAKDHALAQTQSIDELFRAIDDIKDEARTTRLELDKLVKARKESIRVEIRQAALAAYGKHVGDLEKSLEADLGQPLRLEPPSPDFATAMKSKRNIKSLRDAVDDALAKGKIAANELAETYRGNIRRFQELAKDHVSLFPDLQGLLSKSADDFIAAVKLRISDYEKAEEKRLEQERERIRQEETRKLREEQEAAERQRDAQPEQTAPAESAKAPPAPAAPKSDPPVAATTRKPVTLRDELDDWQMKHEINVGAFRALLAILDKYQVANAA